MSEETISIITDTSLEKSAANTRSWEIPIADSVKQKVEVSVEKLEQEMSNFLQVVGRLFKRAEQEAYQKPGMQLNEIELSIEINSEGQISLIGTGAKAGGKGAITLKFKRAELG